MYVCTYVRAYIHVLYVCTHVCMHVYTLFMHACYINSCYPKKKIILPCIPCSLPPRSLPPPYPTPASCAPLPHKCKHFTLVFIINHGRMQALSYLIPTSSRVLRSTRLMFGASRTRTQNQDTVYLLSAAGVAPFCRLSDACLHELYIKCAYLLACTQNTYTRTRTYAVYMLISVCTNPASSAGLLPSLFNIHEINSSSTFLVSRRQQTEPPPPPIYMSTHAYHSIMTGQGR
jgi:hypothetical protein